MNLMLKETPLPDVDRVIDTGTENLSTKRGGKCAPIMQGNVQPYKW